MKSNKLTGLHMYPSKYGILYTLILLFLLWGLPFKAMGDDNDWLIGGSDNNDWFDNSHWSTGLPPTSDESAEINNNDNLAEVEIKSPGALAYLVRVGTTGFASLEISNGGTLDTVKGSVGSYGLPFVSGIMKPQVLVSGAGSKWTMSEGFVIGATRPAVLLIDNGGEVLTGLDSTLGLKYAQGASWVEVVGAGSRWSNAGDLFINDVHNDDGYSLSIRSGGVVTSRNGEIGTDGPNDYLPGSNSSVLVYGSGSAWNNSMQLTLGDSSDWGGASGTLEILSGGTVTSTKGVLGRGSESSGGVFIEGTGSIWANSGDLIIGDSGTGNLSISNGGTVNVGGTVTLAKEAGSFGTLSMTEGILNTSSVTGGAGTVTLNFNHLDGNYFFTNDGTSGGNAITITGTTAVNQFGSGTTFLTGNNTYTGLTTINDGTLVVSGSNSSSTTRVNAGGTLGGAGTVGSVNVNGGTFAPGNSIGTTTVAGNVDFTGGGIYQVEVDTAGNSDLIKASGTATLTNGRVNVQPEAGTYNFSTDYTILTADGGLGNTTFNTVDSNLAFLTPTLSYDANTVFLNLTRNDVDFATIADTPNQKSVANALTNMGRNPSSEVKSFLNKILSLSGPGAQQTFQSLTGVQHTQGQSVSNTLGQKFQQLALNRGSQSQSSQLAFNAQPDSDPLSGILLAYNGDDWMAFASSDTSSGLSRAELRERGLWLRGFGGFGSAKATSGSIGSDYDYTGFAIGVDTQWNDFVFGVAASYARSHVDSIDSNLDMNNYQLAGYGTWKKDAVYVNTVVGVGMHQTDAHRSLVIGSDISTAMAEYNSYDVSLAVETGKDIALSSVTTLTPYIGAEYLHSNREAFTETGAGVANLSVDESDQDSVRSSLGLRISHDIILNEAASIKPFGNIAYVRELTNNVSQMNAAFAASPAATFQVEGSQLDRDRLIVGLGMIGQFNKRMALNIGYSGEFAQSDESHSFSATLRFTW